VRGVEVVVAAPAVGADDPREALPEQRPGLEAVAAGRDPEDRALAGQGAPQRAAGAGGLPAGLVDVDDRRSLELLLEPGVGRGERLPGPLDDRIDRPGRQLDPEQLPGELGRVPAGDAVSDRERHHRGLQPGPERRPRQLARKLGPCAGGAAGAAHPVQPLLAHAHRDQRQLGDLMPPRPRGVDQLPLAEHARAGLAAVGPVLDHLIHLLGRKQRPVPALVPGLPTAIATRPASARPRRRPRRILRRRQRRVARTPAQPPLQLGHPSLKPLVCLHQTLIRLDQLVEPKQQTDSRRTITIENRLRLRPLHPAQLRRNTAGPCTRPERLHLLLS
jgi:hypothetical protein